MTTNLVLYEFTRERIAAGDVSDVLVQFGVRHQSHAVLRALHGRFVFGFAGYDTQPDEVFLISEVRDFVRAFRRACPHWQFFAATQDDSLKAVYAAMLDRVQCVQFPREGMCRVTLDPAELGRLVAEDLACADALCERIGVSLGQRLKRATAIVQSLGLSGGAR